VTLEGLVRLHLQIRRCRHPEGLRSKVCLRPQQEGHFALPPHEFGLDVLALVGRLRHAAHRRVPAIHAEWVRRGVPLGVRSVGTLRDRDDEGLALSLSDTARLRRVTAAAAQVVLALDGLQPDVGHEVLGVRRDVLWGEVLRAQSLLSSTQDDLAPLISEVKAALSVPIVGVVSDGQDSVPTAVTKALDGVPHPRCQFHSLREAAQPVAEADRHAKVPWKKKVRGLRPIERKVEGRADAAAWDIRG
jgi:hypothetical protein